jgi:hypothetical protein
MPVSNARSMMLMEVASSARPPKFMQPKQSGLTLTPVRPKFRYCITYLVRIKKPTRINTIREIRVIRFESFS